MPQGGATKKTLAYRFPQGGPAALSVTLPGDALDLDDARVVTVAVPRDVKALVVDGVPSPVRHRDEAFFVEAALSSPASPVRPTVMDAESLGKARFADYDVVFLLNVRSLGPEGGRAARVRGEGRRALHLHGRRGRSRPLRRGAGRAPAAAAARGEDGRRSAAAPGAEAKAARFADVDWSHPALQVFTGNAREGFEGVRTWRYMLLKPVRAQGRRRRARAGVATTTARRPWWRRGAGRAG